MSAAQYIVQSVDIWSSIMQNNVPVPECLRFYIASQYIFTLQCVCVDIGGNIMQSLLSAASARQTHWECGNSKSSAS